MSDYAAQVLGHLPADVAKWLGPLVAGGLAEAAGAVLEDPTAPGAPTTIAVQARPAPPRPAPYLHLAGPRVPGFQA